MDELNGFARGKNAKFCICCYFKAVLKKNPNDSLINSEHSCLFLYLSFNSLCGSFWTDYHHLSEELWINYRTSRFGTSHCFKDAHLLYAFSLFLICIGSFLKLKYVVLIELTN